MAGTINKRREALLYEKLEDKTVHCQLCAHRCFISSGKRGICSVRENRDGTLYTLVYGKAIAANVDPIEKKPLFHFLPGSKSYSIATAGCNFRCGFCQNWEISQISKGPRGQIVGEKLPPEKIVKEALETGCKSIAYTYTEPTIFFEYAYDTAKLAHKKGLANIFVTNGYQTPETVAKMKGVIDAANVDLKSFSDDFYQKVCGARLKPVLKSIKKLYQNSIFLEITTLIIPDQNDSEKELWQIAKFIAKVSPNIPWHISRFHPDYQIIDNPTTPLETLRRAYDLGKKAGLRYVYLGNVLTDTGENTYCPKCQKLVIERLGYNIRVLAVTNKGKCGYCEESLNIINE
ncbi:MAG: AmmeMemoRadiSam system radical SAM enzyme [bacterium]|nr:AmmeMemoRadiSam system radical SAM enzyme [bacterium]